MFKTAVRLAKQKMTGVDGVNSYYRQFDIVTKLKKTLKIQDYMPCFKHLTLLRSAFFVICSVVALLASQLAYALGAGAATAHSYIGEPLYVTIPLFNVANPDELGIEISASSIGQDISELKAQLEKKNSQLAIAVTSINAINEPYLGFAIQVVDGQQVYNKDFTVLLNLSPQRENLSQQTQSRYTGSTTQSNASIKTIALTGTVNRVGVMGPYQWAEKGNIPEKFGAVLEGQSLWRVARRINKAMGVSINQMMWGLYTQNPGAFSRNSVDSLRAGSYLTIPSYTITSQLSDAQAKVKLNALSTNNSSSVPMTVVNSQPVRVDAVTEDANTVAPIQQGLAASGSVQQTESTSQSRFAEQSANVDSFQLTGISDANRLLGDVNVNDAKSQEIISSLAATVGNLTQELIRKDKRIEFLEEKINTLESVIALNAELASELDVGNNQLSSELNQIASTSVPLEKVDATNNEQVKSGSIWWLWVLPLVLLLLLGVIFRERLSAVIKNLNLFGSNDDIGFDNSILESAPPILTERTPSASKTSASQRDFSDMLSSQAAQDNEMNDIDVVEEVSYLSFNDIDEEATDIQDDDSVLDFEERFSRLIAEQDYDFARELLDFARHNEIDEDRYHCERLRLYQAMRDEDGFYDYYYEIESKIPNFSQQIQNRISQLVVELGQQ